MVGALLIVVAGIGTFAAARRGGAQDQTHYVVVTRAVAPGARLAADDLALRPMTLDADVAHNAYRSLGSLSGAVALAPLGAGQLLQRAEVALATTIGATAVAPSHELTIPVPADRTPAGLRRGETVAVLATYGTGTDASTVVTVQRATILGVSEPGDSLTSRGTARLTLALTDAETVLDTAHAAQVADLTVVRTTLATDDLPERGTASKARSETAPTTSGGARTSS